jgi:hypothetical protein
MKRLLSILAVACALLLSAAPVGAQALEHLRAGDKIQRTLKQSRVFEAGQGRLRLRGRTAAPPGGGGGDEEEPGAGARTLIDVNTDITYLGSCELPLDLQPFSAGLTYTSHGMTGGYTNVAGFGHIVEDGVGHFIATAQNSSTAGQSGFLYKFRCDDFASSPTAGHYPTATLEEYYGYPLGALRVDLNGDLLNGGCCAGPNGMLAVGSNVWFTWSVGTYSDDSGGKPVLAYCTRGSSSCTAQAAYAFEDRGHKQSDGPILQVPTWFADAHFEGKRHMLYGGGNHSLHGFSTDPTAIVLNLPTGQPNGTEIENISANFKPVAVNVVPGCPDTTHRLPQPAFIGDLVANHTSDKDCGAGIGGAGGWTLHDGLLTNQINAAVWVDTGAQHCILHLITYSTAGAYIAAAVQQDKSRHSFACLDPLKYAETYAGTRNPSTEIEYDSNVEIQYGGLDYNEVPFKVYEYTGVTIAINATSDRFRFTFPTPPIFTEANGLLNQVITYGGSTADLRSGFTIHENISSTVFDACSGQSCGDIAPEFDGLTDTNMTVRLVSASALHGPAGATFMYRHSACGPNNTLAVLMPSPSLWYGTPLPTRIHCFQMGTP